MISLLSFLLACLCLVSSLQRVAARSNHLRSQTSSHHSHEHHQQHYQQQHVMPKSLSSENSVRRRSRQLFSNPSNPLLQGNDVDVDLVLENLAGDIHDLLTRTLVVRRDHHQQQQAEHQDNAPAFAAPADTDNMVTLTDDVSGLTIDSFGPDDDTTSVCALQGNVRFTTNQLEGLDDIHTEQVELVKGSEDYEPIIVDDDDGTLLGYQYVGVWKVMATIDPFLVDITSQVRVDACGHVLDFSTYGGVAVNGTTITATIRVDGILSKKLNDAHFVEIQDVEILQRHIQFDSAASTGLDFRLPLDFEDELHSLIEFLFVKKLERPSLLPIAASASAETN